MLRHLRAIKAVIRYSLIVKRWLRTFSPFRCSLIPVLAPAAERNRETAAEPCRSLPGTSRDEDRSSARDWWSRAGAARRRRCGTYSAHHHSVGRLAVLPPRTAGLAGIAQRGIPDRLAP